MATDIGAIKFVGIILVATISTLTASATTASLISLMAKVPNTPPKTAGRIYSKALFRTGGNDSSNLPPMKTPINSITKFTTTDTPIAIVDIIAPSSLPSVTPAAFCATAEAGTLTLDYYPLKTTYKSLALLVLGSMKVVQLFVVPLHRVLLL